MQATVVISARKISSPQLEIGSLLLFASVRILSVIKFAFVINVNCIMCRGKIDSINSKEEWGLANGHWCTTCVFAYILY